MDASQLFRPSEIFGFITGVLCVWLGAREKVVAWPIGIANNAIFLAIFWRNGLYAIAGLQIIYAAISVYGWWNWLHGGTNRSSLPISRASSAVAAWLALATVAGAAALFVILRTWTDSSVPGWDAATTALSIAAQFMLSRKMIENWFVWLGVDVIYVALACSKGLYITAALYLAFMVLCVSGLLHWSRLLRDREAAAVGSPV